MKSLLARFSTLNRDLKLLWFAIFCLSFGFAIYNACNYNFLTQKLGIEPIQLGYAEAIRELPGFLCFIAAAITMQIAEPLVAAIAICIMGLGVGAYSCVTGVPSLMLFSFIWSAGFHIWQALQSSMVLGLADSDNRGKRLGQTAGVASFGAICGTLLISFTASGVKPAEWHYPKWFLLAGACILLAGLVMFAIRRSIGHAEKPRFVLKKKYKLYYLLTLLEGGRKQVFMTFAVFALTREFRVQLDKIALLMLINLVLSMISAPIVGLMIDKIGERKIMLFSYTSLIFVFIGYAVAPSIYKFFGHAFDIRALFVLYTLDNVLFISTNCLSTYLHSIADAEDLMPTLSMGVSFNHTAAVIVPLVGGLLWAKYGYAAAFLGGAVLVAVSALVAIKVPLHKRKAAQVAL